MSSTAPDSAVLEELSIHIETVLHLCQSEPDLRMYALKFQVEHAAAKSAFEGSEDAPRSPSIASTASGASGNSGAVRSPSPLADEAAPLPMTLDKRHLLAALRRVCDMSLAVMRHIHSSRMRAAAELAATGGPGALSSDAVGFGSSPDLSGATGAAAASSDGGRSSIESPTMGAASMRSNSVDDVDAAENSAPWVEHGATLYYSAVQAVTLALIADQGLRPLVQNRLLQLGAVAVLRDALTIDRRAELAYFAEGYRTALMNLLANLSFANEAVAAAVADSPALLNCVLSSTRIDEENPGLVEWAEFTLRNVCVLSDKARREVGALRAVAVDPRSRAEVQTRSGASLDLDADTGKLRFTTVEM